MARNAILKSFARYNQPLKRSENRLQNLAGYISNLSKLKRKKKEKELSIDLWAKFDEVDFDGFSILAVIKNGNNKTQVQSCTFNVSYVTQGPSWNKTLIGSYSGALGANGFTASIPNSVLPSSIGDYTFYVECVVSRRGEQLSKEDYFNHFYTLEQTTRNRNKIKFLEITKADE